MKIKNFLILSSIFIILISVSYLKGTFKQETLNSSLIEIYNGDIKLKFTIGKLIQGVDKGDLPFHYYTHPDSKIEFMANNPGIITSYDFLIWAGGGFKEKLSKTDKLSCELEQKGLVFVRNQAEKNLRGFQMVLASYYFYFMSDTKKGIFWAQKAAELGETGSMVILGDALTNSLGVVNDNINGLKWYIIASSMGDLAAQGRLLALYFNSEGEEFNNERKLALIEARAWMKSHSQYFISEE